MITQKQLMVCIWKKIEKLWQNDSHNLIERNVKKAVSFWLLFVASYS